MASINFLAGGFGFPIQNLNNSGLGFFGPGGFGQSVPVNTWQGSTFITDGNGVNQGPQVNNVQWVHPNSGAVQGGTILSLNTIPNYQGTLNIHFNNSTPVRTQNAQLFIYDRVSTSNPPSSVMCAVAQLIHPNVVQGGGGSGDTSWQFPAGSSYLNASVLNNGSAFSPGQSGLSPQGGATIDMNHDWYFCLSANPTTIGSKTNFGLLFSTEYL
jgi:hypothetical protein